MEWLALFIREFVGTKVKMDLEISGDTLIFRGPVREDGTIDKRNNFIDKLVRLN